MLVFNVDGSICCRRNSVAASLAIPSGPRLPAQPKSMVLVAAQGTRNTYGQYDDLLCVLTPALGQLHSCPKRTGQG